MDGMESKLQRLLNDPEALGAVMNMAKSLKASGDSSGEPEQSPDEGETVPSAAGSGDSGNLFSLLDNIDPATIGKLMGLMGEYTRTDDRRTLLLNALKPYLRSERAEKIDKAGQIVRIARTASKALNTWQSEES